MPLKALLPRYNTCPIVHDEMKLYNGFCYMILGPEMKNPAKAVPPPEKTKYKLIGGPDADRTRDL
jgi:hypothetical protein